MPCIHGLKSVLYDILNLLLSSASGALTIVEEIYGQVSYWVRLGLLFFFTLFLHAFTVLVLALFCSNLHFRKQQDVSSHICGKSFSLDFSVCCVASPVNTKVV